MGKTIIRHAILSELGSYRTPYAFLLKKKPYIPKRGNIVYVGKIELERIENCTSWFVQGREFVRDGGHFEIGENWYLSKKDPDISNILLADDYMNEVGDFYKIKSNPTK